MSTVEESPIEIQLGFKLENVTLSRISDLREMIANRQTFNAKQPRRLLILAIDSLFANTPKVTFGWLRKR